MSEAQTTLSPDEAIEQAVALAAECLGELMEFWNFKPSMGKVWAVLYLSPEPLSAEEIGRRTSLSAGSVSMTLNDLQLWGVVHQVREPGGRRRLYRPETDIWAMVTRVFRERELRMVRRAIGNLEAALALIEQRAGSSDPQVMLRGRFVATRVRLLLDLARTGDRMLERLARSGELDLTPLRGWLEGLRRRAVPG